MSKTVVVKLGDTLNINLDETTSALLQSYQKKNDLTLLDNSHITTTAINNNATAISALATNVSGLVTFDNVTQKSHVINNASIADVMPSNATWKYSGTPIDSPGEPNQVVWRSQMNIAINISNLWNSGSDANLKFGRDINLKGYNLTNVATPVNGTDGANKTYVDTKQDKLVTGTFTTIDGNKVNVDAVGVGLVVIGKTDYPQLNGDSIVSAINSYQNVNQNIIQPLNNIVKVNTPNKTLEYINTPGVFTNNTLVDFGTFNAVQTEVARGTFWQEISITGSGTRTALLTSPPFINGRRYRCDFTWSNSFSNGVTSVFYQAFGTNTTDLQRYWHSGVAGLLPNVLAIANNLNTGFKIYCPIGTQNTDGFIYKVYIETPLTS